MREVAQLGAILGREFDYEMIQSLAVLDDARLQVGLSQLVTHELLYQRGRVPRAKYIFRHALIRDAAYQSLLIRTRQRHHQRIAQTLEERFPETVATQPELVAYHYTEASLADQAIGYWQRAGKQAIQHSAYAEGLGHSYNGLKLLTSLPETPERLRQELDLQVTIGPALLATRGFGDEEVERAYERARVLCQQTGEASQYFDVQWGLWRYYSSRGVMTTARELAEALLTDAQGRQDPEHLLIAHSTLGQTFGHMGDHISARPHLEASIAGDRRQADRQTLQTQANRYMIPNRLSCHYWLGNVLWTLGYPDQAEQTSHEMLAFGQAPVSRLGAQAWRAYMHQLRGEVEAVQELVEEGLSVSHELKLPQIRAAFMILGGWVLAAQGQGDEGIRQIREGLAAVRTMGIQVIIPRHLASLALIYRRCGEVEKGLRAVEEALVITHDFKPRWWDPELHRLRGELLLAQENPRRQVGQAETSLQQALTLARQQCAKSWELRAATSLARLWQSQDKRKDAHDLLAPVYGWFIEGFDTADLIDAKALLDELTEGVP